VIINTNLQTTVFLGEKLKKADWLKFKQYVQ